MCFEDEKEVRVVEMRMIQCEISKVLFCSTRRCDKSSRIQSDQVVERREREREGRGTVIHSIPLSMSSIWRGGRKEGE